MYEGFRNYVGERRIKRGVCEEYRKSTLYLYLFKRTKNQFCSIKVLQMVIVVLGRSIRDCFDRDLRLAESLVGCGLSVEVVVPTKSYMNDGYSSGDVARLRSLSRLRMHTIDTVNQLSDISSKNNSRLAVFSQNNAHRKAIRQLRKKQNVFCVSYSSYASLDHFNLGEDVTLLRSDMMKELNVLNLSRRERARADLIVTGCLSQLGRGKVNAQTARLELGLQKGERAVGFHPKNIEVLQARIPVWFKFKSSRWRREYLSRVDDIYAETSRTLREHGYKVFETVHPSAGEACSRYGNSIVLPENKYLLLNVAEFGVGVTSTISMEYGYVHKPFLFCGSEHVVRPNISKWDYLGAFKGVKDFPIDCVRPINPWQAFWIGEYVSSIDEFKGVESSLLSNDYDYNIHNQVFWGGANSNVALNNITKVIQDCIRDRL